MRSSLTCVRICPSSFLPLQVALVFALGLLAESPIPQRQSLGAASTNSVPAVPNRAFFRSAFCENCYKKRHTCTQEGPCTGGLSYHNTQCQSTIIPKNSHPIYKIQISFYNILANFDFTCYCIEGISFSRKFAGGTTLSIYRFQ